MANITITRITRTNGNVNNYNIIEGFGIAAAHTVLADAIFSDTEAVPAAATEGRHPAAFRYDRNGIPLIVTGSRGAYFAGQYRLKGTGPGNFQIISQPFALAPGPGPGAGEFTADGFTSVLDPLGPFRLAGNWQWAMVRATDGSNFANGPATRLEIYFLFGPHTIPTFAGIDFPLSLLRLAFPEYATHAGLNAAALQARVITDITTRMWDTGMDPVAPLRYDCRERHGGQSVHALALDFNLETITTRPNGRTTCNCCDLACWVKLTIDCLGEGPGTGAPYVAGVTVMYEEPWGCVPAGPLFGWENDPASANCNNPFWQDVNGVARFQPNVAPNDPTRTILSTHCFTVFTDTAGQQRVVDICHGLYHHGVGPVILPHGDMDLATYRTTCTDPPKRVVNSRRRGDGLASLLSEVRQHRVPQVNNDAVAVADEFLVVAADLMLPDPWSIMYAANAHP
ncbi:hypothetical protein B0T26DRAFT_872039 [Lasiosphaeria miniovina]|uniref:Uncharacterized protein n=1 Tax=Lasiosphaeria miniovina TaxID=1954250 RepID=A0AA40AKP2_9PEZI|nr:uncharacterized protein B0T26DRAFT_872039 [Lasiosphaeria miniovina]KAK0717613.1 hypothetical protein B0T26DRAFT_872039 [Lasiosphaeria miniovina]